MMTETRPRLRPGIRPPQALLAADVAGIADGDPGALERLYDATSATVLALAERVLHDALMAEEVVLDVFRHVWQQPEAYAPERGSVLAWLMTITRSRAVDRWRSQDSRGRHESPLSENELQHADTKEAPVDTLVADERRQILERALLSLSSTERHVIECAFFEGMSHEAIARSLGEPLGTVKSQIRRGLIKMQRLLGEQGAVE